MIPNHSQCIEAIHPGIASELPCSPNNNGGEWATFWSVGPNRIGEDCPRQGAKAGK